MVEKILRFLMVAAPIVGSVATVVYAGEPTDHNLIANAGENGTHSTEGLDNTGLPVGSSFEKAHPVNVEICGL